jgi:hypothetical protein
MERKSTNAFPLENYSPRASSVPEGAQSKGAIRPTPGEVPAFASLAASPPCRFVRKPSPYPHAAGFGKGLARLNI